VVTTQCNQGKFGWFFFFFFFFGRNNTWVRSFSLRLVISQNTQLLPNLNFATIMILC
jgi:hypothetical protein